MNSSWHLINGRYVGVDDFVFVVPCESVEELRDFADGLLDDADSALIEEVEVVRYGWGL